MLLTSNFSESFTTSYRIKKGLHSEPLPLYQLIWYYLVGKLDYHSIIDLALRRKPPGHQKHTDSLF